MLKINYNNAFRIALLSAVLGLIMIFIPWNSIDDFHFGNYKFDIDSYANLGTFVGGISAPFLSFSAFILLYMTFMSQKKELEETRVIFKNQSDTLEKQQFETTFFNLLNLHHQIVNNIELSIIKNKIGAQFGESEIIEKTEGRDCFKIFFVKYSEIYKNTEKDDKYKNMIETSYEKLFDEYQSYLSHYFRNLYHIYKLIANSEITDKKNYSSILRAQLSSYELLLLFYNGQSKIGAKFKILIEEFGILKNINEKALIQIQHINLYNSSAFGK